MEKNLSEGEKEELEKVSKERINKGFWELVAGLGDFFRHLFDLQDGMDRLQTINNIKNNKRMQGANVWLLFCSIMVASLGLDLNSPAVIIGAMLISPLMSPILGVGLGVGINDRETLLISLRHFGIAIAIALFTSTMYFLITPLGTATPEILARTKPTFLDAMVAVFGGFAGIVSASRKDQSNAIPGVAIATALMPPLCVSGFGIATWNPTFILNSFYLFFLNSVFIALTTYAIVRYLKFPFKKYVNRREKTRTTAIIAIVSILLILPSTWILSGVIFDIRQKNIVKEYVNTEFNTNTRRAISHAFIQTDSVSYIEINYLSKDSSAINDKQRKSMEKRLEKLGVRDPRLTVFGTVSNQNNLSRVSNAADLQRTEMMQQMSLREQEKELEIKRLKEQLDSTEEARNIETIVDEAKVFLPHLADIDIVQSKFDKYPILLIKWDEDIYSSKVETALLYDFVKLKTGLDSIVIYD